MTSEPTREPSGFDWKEHRAAAALIAELIEEHLEQIPFLRHLQERLLNGTGTRLADWVDHFDVDFSKQNTLGQRLRDAGFLAVPGIDKEILVHPGAIFPAIAQSNDAVNRIGIKVESVVDFVAAHQIQTVVTEQPFAARRLARICGNPSHEVWAIEKHGVQSWENPPITQSVSLLIPRIRESFLMRDRRCQTDAEGFHIAASLIDDSIARIGVSRTCDLFFQAERHYWQLRNRAARVQKARQDSLGMGWANHDHHTYRSSRESFKDLIGILEKLGFVCRESFFAGAEAGWGAQVLEQSECGLVVFADVDLSEEELAGDFAHEGLSPRQDLGTVGLWCALHGEAFLQAGMHHLECQFDYTTARQLLESDGVQCMQPFTDFEFLKQCFTTPEFWQVEEHRLAHLVAQNQISAADADKFRTEGAAGSHLEVLERNNGFKGFNQQGVSKIIAKTDPRKLSGSSAE